MGLLQLPSELLGIILDSLNAEGFSALRLASRSTNAAALPTFSRRYFETRHVMLSQLSLDNILQIAQHPVFGLAVAMLELCTDHFTEFPGLLELGSTQHYDDMIEAMQEGRRQSSGARREMPSDMAEEAGYWDWHDQLDTAGWESLWKEQVFMMQSGLAVAHLTRTLTGLANLRGITIDNGHRPWGALAHRRLAGLPPANVVDRDIDTESYFPQLLHTVLMAVVASRIPLCSFTVRPNKYEDGITPDLLKSSRRHLRFYQGLPSSLSELAVVVSTRSAERADDEWAGDLLAFIGIFQHIKQLSLSFNGAIFRRTNRLRQITPRLLLPSLQELSISGAYCSILDLRALFTAHQTSLKRIELCEVEITEGIDDWKSLFALLRDQFSLDVLWVEECRVPGLGVFLRQIRQGDKEEYVQEIEFHGRQEEWTGIIDGIVTGESLRGSSPGSSILDRPLS